MRLMLVLAFLSLGVLADAEGSPGNASVLGERGVYFERSENTGTIYLIDDHDDSGHHHGEDHHRGEKGREVSRGWGSRPGWHSSWRYERDYHPNWWHPKFVFPGFVWLNVYPGVWQCTAFNQYDQYLAPYTYVGQSQGQAAYGALYDCGGPNYQATGCYIPAGYCQRR